MIFADLHTHSKYSRATSNKMDIKHLSKFGSMKGVDVFGTGDITHPEWRKEVKEETEYLGDGVFKSKYNSIRFVLSSEIATIYSKDDEVRKIHHLLFFPNLEVVEQFTSELRNLLTKRGKKCNLEADGRPIIGLDSVELIELLLNVCDDNVLVPAHIWTPWFSLYGSKSGFDSITDCYEEFTSDIPAVETGLSSDPGMNWRVGELSDKLLISNSDCHSPYPHRIGRECNVLPGEPREFTYDYLLKCLRGKRMNFSLEVDPRYGKYYFDGHRAHEVHFTPEESERVNNKCPECGEELTLGVLHRVHDVSDKPAGFKPGDAVPFELHIPLAVIISNLVNVGVGTKTVNGIYEKLVKKFGNEFNIMLDVDVGVLNSALKGLGDVVQELRSKSLRVKPGYDGVYGEPVIESVRKVQSQLLEF